MCVRTTNAAAAESFYARWTPSLLRFFHLFAGNQGLAESLAVETCVRHLHTRRCFCRDEDTPVSLFQCAFQLAMKASRPVDVSADPVVRATTELPVVQRAIVVLWGAISLDSDTIAAISGLERARVVQLCTEGLFQLRTHFNRGGGREFS